MGGEFGREATIDGGGSGSSDDEVSKEDLGHGEAVAALHGRRPRRSGEMFSAADVLACGKVGFVKAGDGGSRSKRCRLGRCLAVPLEVNPEATAINQERWGSPRQHGDRLDEVRGSRLI